jgi:hypothetical protein
VAFCAARQEQSGDLSIFLWRADPPDGVRYWPWRTLMRQGRFFSRPRKPVLSRENPKDDPRQRTDKPSIKQTDAPWKGNPEKEQRSSVRKDDLEKWQRSDTH